MGLLTLLARRFVAGQTITEAAAAIRKLNSNNILATVDFLGENVSNQEEALLAADEYIRILEEIENRGLDCNVSLKLTMMGLEVDSDFCFKNVRRIVEKAQDLGNFVRIDMEGSPVTQATLDIFERLYANFPNVGIVIQAYLHRSEKDIRYLAQRGVNVRLCKGAYKEGPEVAFQSKEEVNRNFLRLAEILLKGKGKTAIATHDKKILYDLKQTLRDWKIESERYEFQMLYGIERKLQLALAREGEPFRVYVPYGTDWLGYFSRRMIERRENLLFAVKHFLLG